MKRVRFEESGYKFKSTIFTNGKQYSYLIGTQDDCIQFAIDNGATVFSTGLFNHDNFRLAAIDAGLLESKGNENLMKVGVLIRKSSVEEIRKIVGEGTYSHKMIDARIDFSIPFFEIKQDHSEDVDEIFIVLSRKALTLFELFSKKSLGTAYPRCRDEYLDAVCFGHIKGN